MVWATTTCLVKYLNLLHALFQPGQAFLVPVIVTSRVLPDIEKSLCQIDIEDNTRFAVVVGKPE
jgi:hypothetical protein